MQASMPPVVASVGSGSAMGSRPHKLSATQPPHILKPKTHSPPGSMTNARVIRPPGNSQAACSHPGRHGPRRPAKTQEPCAASPKPLKAAAFCHNAGRTGAASSAFKLCRKPNPNPTCDGMHDAYDTKNAYLRHARACTSIICAAVISVIGRARMRTRLPSPFGAGGRGGKWASIFRGAARTSTAGHSCDGRCGSCDSPSLAV
jgi:hypothetical protein